MGPFTGGQTAVPGQQGSRRDQPTAAQRGRQQPGQCRPHRAVGPVRLRLGDLTAEHHHLVTQHHDLRVLGRLTSAQQAQPAEDPDRDQVQQTDKHKPRSCPNPSTRPSRRPQPMRRVLERYTSKALPTWQAQRPESPRGSWWARLRGCRVMSRRSPYPQEFRKRGPRGKRRSRCS